MKKININAFIWMIVLFLYSYMMLDLLVSGDIQFYLHPKMLPFVYFALFVILVLAMYQTTRIFKATRVTKIYKGHILFLIPLLLAFTVSPKGVSIQTAENKGVYTINSSNIKIDNINDMPQFVDDGSIYEIVNFMDVLTEMHYSPKVYEDKTVKLTGFFYKESTYDAHEFLIARLLVSCCAADAQVAGFRCEWENIGTLEQGKWYEVEGTVRIEATYNELFKMEEILATIDVISAVEVSEPDNPYIFP